MNAVVADASALVEYLVGSERGARVAVVIEDPSVDLHTASLCDVEVVSALRGLLRGRKIEPGRARQVVQDYSELPLTRHGHLALLDRVLDLRDNFSAYDAVYLVLAEVLDARVLTCDEALALAMESHTPRVELAI